MAIVKVNFDRVHSPSDAREVFEEEFSHPILPKTLDISRVPCVDERLLISSTTWRVTGVRHRAYFSTDVELAKQALEFDASIFLTPDLDPESLWQ